MKYNITINGRIGCWPNYGPLVRDEVLSLKGKPCSVYVNSPGGSVVDALEMYQAFKEHGDVTVHIFGFTASAATLVAMGAKTVEMSQNALMLIHKSSIFQDFWGSMNSDQLDEAIKQLEDSKDTLNKIDEIIANIYALRAGNSKETFLEKMKTAAWLRASDVKELGLIDNILADVKVANELTNDVKNDINELKLPMPDEELLHSLNERPSLTDRIKTVLAQMGLLKNDEKTKTEESSASAVNETQTHTTMNKEFTAINAALSLEGLTAEDGKVSLSLEQLKTLNSALLSAEDRAKKAEDAGKEKDNTIAGLQTQVENLKEGDGAATTQNEGAAQNSGEEKVSSAAAEYDAIKHLL